MKSIIVLFICLLLLACGFLFYTNDKAADLATMPARVQATIAAARFGAAMDEQRTRYVPTLVQQSIDLKQSEIDKANAEAELTRAQAQKVNAENIANVFADCFLGFIILLGACFIVHTLTRVHFEKL